MPLRNIKLTPEEQEFVMRNVESGRFGTAGEMVQAALQSLKREERARQERAEIEKFGVKQIQLPHYRRINTSREIWIPERRRW